LSAVAGIILAAGSSRRLGQPKQMVLIGGETLLQRAIRVANQAGLEPVLVVISEHQAHQFSATGEEICEALINFEAADGMASSIRVGVAKAIEIGSAGVVVMACDQPAVTAEHLQKLLADGEEVVASGYAGRRGVPAYFPASAFDDLMKLQGDAGARNLLRTARCVELANGELDVDTPEELAKAQALFG
jgi:molybdenum cofactor cytidylyltransferase